MSIEERIDKIGAFIQERDQQTKTLLDALRAFADLLYGSIDKVLKTANDKGVSHGTTAKKNDLGNGFKSLSFDWDGSRLTFFPYQVAAYPSDEALSKIPKQQAGRLAYFYHGNPNDTSVASIPIGEFYVYPDGQWYVLGFGGFRMGRIGNGEEQLANLVMSLLETITYNMTRRHYSIEKTSHEYTRANSATPIGFPTPKSN
jgi:hypothetical protein